MDADRISRDGNQHDIGECLCTSPPSRWVCAAAFGNLLTVAAVYFLMQPNAAAFGVIASEGAAFVFLVSALLD
jgi:hypothetical protein